ncbi:MAG: lipopolysaccharide biosynthesis protein [Methylobacteriaceae bacterium]|nr:lipopolysaccharide biosynthesis protein [Methylobacteriaceae bacterium]
MDRGRNTDTARMNGQAESELDLGALTRGVARRKWWIIGTTLAAFLITLAAVNFIKPRYTGEAKVFLENQESYFTRPGKETPEQPPALDPEAVQSQVQLVTSRDLARQAVRKLNLLGNAEFDPLADGMDLLTRAMVLLGLDRDPRQMSPEDRVLDTYYDRLIVYPVAKTRVLQIEFSARDPELAAKGANTIAELYIDLQEEAKKNNAKAAGAWLAPNIEALRAKVTEAEAKVEDFRAQSGLLVGSNNTTISAQQLADLNTQLANARSTEADAQAKAKLIRELLREGRVSEVSDVAKDELIRNIGQQRVTLRAQLASESRTLLPGHPRIQELTAQLADVDNALRLAADKAARSLENDARIAGSRVEALTAELDAQKKAVATGNGDEVQLHALEREAAAARDQLETFLQKYREATARDADNAAPADARIISRAIAPELPSFPKKVPMLVIGTLAGFLLSFGIVVSRELLSGRATAPPDLGATPRPAPVVSAVAEGDETLVEAPPTAADPSPAAAPPIARPAPTSAGSSTGEDARRGGDVAGLARHIEELKPSGHAACILVCGVDRGSGATVAAIDLARALARDGRAIIVDFDSGGPGLDRFVSDGPTVGLADLVAGRKSFAEVIHRDRTSRLHVLPAGDAGKSQAGDGERLNLILDALVATYDYIVFDGSPVSDGKTSLDLASWAGLTVLVTARGEGERDTIAAANALVEAGAEDLRVLTPEGKASAMTASLDAA